jgi:hypothetical protein
MACYQGKCMVILDAGLEAGGSTPDARREGLVPDHAIPDRVRPADSTAAPQLTSSHTGYKNPLCFTCHGVTTKYPHTSSGYKEPDCAECHGYNGAPHKSHATKSNSCGSCHCSSCSTPTSHYSNFKSPDDCIACHYHPGTT